jgi:hypothetical protein
MRNVKETSEMDNLARTPYDAPKKYESVPVVPQNDPARSGVSWAAVAAGAFVAGAMSLALMTLGAGIGLSSVSMWPNSGVSASRLGPMAVLWVILVQILSCAFGGYLAGRLRTKWIAVHTHEVYFRDTAHGFLVWAVGLVLTVLFLSSTATTVARNEAIASNDTRAHASDYFVDSLFRTAHPETSRNDEPARAEAGLILANAMREPALVPQDRLYLTELVSAHTGLNKAEAERRVDDTVAADRYAADNARKALAHSFYWLFVALLCGAFFASFAATVGGRQRDHVPAHVPA